MFLEHQIGIRMISEGSCDTELMAADNSALQHRNKLHFKTYSSIQIFPNITVKKKKKKNTNFWAELYNGCLH